MVSPALACARSPIAAILPARIPISARPDATMIDDDATPQDQIKGLRHEAIHCYKRACVAARAQTHTSPARAKSRLE